MSTNSRERKRLKEYQRGLEAGREGRTRQPNESRSGRDYLEGARDGSAELAVIRDTQRRREDAWR